MEKVCGSTADIASWTDQVLDTWAGAASSTEQDVLEFLSALAKANKDILCPSEELCCKLLFDTVVVARVQDNEHLASQQCALSSLVQGLVSSSRGSASAPHGSNVQ
ncbi:hypothetical protein E2C01_059654 [Portunus trituberculatus]|uniref:Uncharacterized protein n=1 Tax=Portunus trituberculatus TaxID=210409 RepID=A0A5B7H900_PORTR|nr:hypothetical protein [Portunus trituberculatus]